MAQRSTLRLSTCTASLVAALATAAGGTAQAAVIPHDQVRGYGPSLGPVNAKFQPYLVVSGGCVPYPAVDAAGNVSGGLQPSGDEDGHCARSPGQVYVRHGSEGGRCAIVYAWFFPKDQNAAGGVNNGHRYDWEDVVVWLDQCSLAGRILQVSYSSHGSYIKRSTSGADAAPLQGSHPLVEYGQEGLFLDHSLYPAQKAGGLQPGIAWETLSPAARNTLNSFDFKAAIVPIKDSTLSSNLQKAN